MCHLKVAHILNITFLFVLFTDSITEINITQIDDPQKIDVVMPV